MLELLISQSVDKGGPDDPHSLRAQAPEQDSIPGIKGRPGGECCPSLFCDDQHFTVPPSCPLPPTQNHLGTDLPISASADLPIANT